MMPLTLDELTALKPNTIFAQGTVENSPDGIFMTHSDFGRLLLWVAKKGCHKRLGNIYSLGRQRN